MNKKAVGLILAGAVLSAALTGCVTSKIPAQNNQGQPDGETVAAASGTEGDSAQADTNVKRTLKLYAHYGDSEREILDYAMAKVQEKYPNVTFEVEAHAQDDGQTLKTRAATGDMPDIAHVNAGDVEALSASASLMDLTDLLVETGYADKLAESAKDTPYYDDGKAYIFPDAGAQAILLYYNKKVFADNNIEIPTNYEELAEAAKQLKAKGVIPCALFAKEGFTIGAFFDMFAMKYNPGGIKALSEGEAHASEEGYTKAIEKMMALVNDGFFQAGCTSADYETAQNLFTSGQAAMFINGDWDIAGLTQKLGGDLGYFTSYPMADAGMEQEQNYYAFSGGYTYEGYAISSDTEDPALVADVTAILAEASVVGNYLYTAKIPTVINVDTSALADVEIPPLALVEGEELKNMVFETAWTHTLKNVEFSTPFVELLQEMLTGMETQEAIDAIDELVDSVGGKR